MDKEAPGLIRMHSMAYLSGFPASFKETEQLRVKLPTVITNKINQVKHVCCCYSIENVKAVTMKEWPSRFFACLCSWSNILLEVLGRVCSCSSERCHLASLLYI